MIRKSIMRWAGYLLLSLSALTPLALQAADVWAVRDTQLRNSPAFGSAKNATVAKGEKLAVLTRTGGWLNVSRGTDTGWLRSYEARRNKLNITTSANGQKTGLVGTIQGLSRSTSKLLGSKASQSAKRNVVATLGVRGLSEEQLNQAKPNYKVLDSLDAYKASSTKARTWASKGGLQSASISYISPAKAAKRYDDDEEDEDDF